MCGIFGFQVREGAEITETEAAILGVTLASAMESRGRDSFGVAAFADGDRELYKGLGRITENGHSAVRLISHNRKFLGHTRAATVGEVNIPNSHPFEIGDVLGVHNGSVGNYSELNERYGRNFPVDSQQIFAHLDEDKSLMEVSGYGTVFYARRSEGYENIRLFKTNGGVITVGRFYRDPDALSDSKDHFMVVWASEADAVYKCSRLIGAKYYSVTISPDTWYRITDGEIYEEPEAINKGFRGFSTYTSSNSNSSQARHNTGGYLNNYDFTPEEKEWMKARGFGTSGFDARRRASQKVTVTTTGSDDGVIRLTKSQRKLLRSRSTISGNLTKHEWDIYTAEPTEDNVTRISKLVTTKLKDRDTGTISDVAMCGECQCPQRFHDWGLCAFNKLSLCAQNLGKTCKSLVAKMCRDCGHALTEDIHAYGTITGTLWCQECSAYCIPEAELERKFHASIEEAKSGEESTDLVVWTNHDTDAADDDETPSKQQQEVDDAAASFITSPDRIGASN